MKRTLLVGQDEAVAQFIADLAPIERPAWPKHRHAFGVLRGDGRLIAGVVFATDRPEFSSWEMSAAALCSHPFSIEIVNALGAFAFRQLSAYRIWARTSTDNKRARALLKGLGFTEEGVNACHYGARRHAVVARLLKPEWEKRVAAVKARKAA
jgi:RimJ/RimL family protein N-acetyltransferase